MEYLIGVVLGFASFIFLQRVTLASIKTNKDFTLKFSQAYINSMISPLSTIVHFEKPIKTQATTFFDSNHVRIVFVENSAYWIENSTLYTADVVDGGVDTENKKVVDTIAIDRVELDKISSIVDLLTDGENNDNGYPGQQKF